MILMNTFDISEHYILYMLLADIAATLFLGSLLRYNFTSRLRFKMLLTVAFHFSSQPPLCKWLPFRNALNAIYFLRTI
jgi:hypothetical protein